MGVVELLNLMMKDTIRLLGPPSLPLVYSTTVFHLNQEHGKLPGAAAELPFFVSITRCQCVAVPSRHGQAVVVAAGH